MQAMLTRSPTAFDRHHNKRRRPWRNFAAMRPLPATPRSHQEETSEGDDERNLADPEERFEARCTARITRFLQTTDY